LTEGDTLARRSRQCAAELPRENNAKHREDAMRRRELFKGAAASKIPGLAGVGPKGGAQSVAPLRLARSGTRAGQLCGPAGAVAALPVDRDDGRVRSVPAAR